MAIGGLIGLCFIKFTWIGIPVGAVIGGALGLALTSGPSRNPVGMDGDEIADIASTGCMALSCLSDLACLGFGTLLCAILAGGIGGFMMLIR